MDNRKAYEIIGATIGVVIILAISIVLAAVLISDDSATTTTATVGVPVEITTVTVSAPDQCSNWNPPLPACILPGYTVITPNGQKITSTSPPVTSPGTIPTPTTTTK